MSERGEREQQRVWECHRSRRVQLEAEISSWHYLYTEYTSLYLLGIFRDITPVQLWINVVDLVCYFFLSTFFYFIWFILCRRIRQLVVIYIASLRTQHIRSEKAITIETYARHCLHWYAMLSWKHYPRHNLHFDRLGQSGSKPAWYKRRPTSVGTGGWKRIEKWELPDSFVTQTRQDTETTSSWTMA